MLGLGILALGELGLGMLGLGMLGELGLEDDELGELVGGVGRLGDPELLGGDGMLGDEVDEGEGGVGIEVLLWLAHAPNARDANKIRLVSTRIACLPGDPGIMLEVLYYSPERTSLAPAAALSAASSPVKKGTRGVPGYS